MLPFSFFLINCIPPSNFLVQIKYFMVDTCAIMLSVLVVCIEG